MTITATDYSNVTITVPVLEGNLLAGSNTEGVDTRASVLAYCAAIEARMETAFPGITIDHEIQWNTEGSAGRTYVSDFDREDEITEVYNHIAEQVFADYNWIVEIK